MEGGLLDVTVEYRALSRSSDDDQPSLEQSYVTLSIGVLRATGLKVHMCTCICVLGIHDYSNVWVIDDDFVWFLGVCVRMQQSWLPKTIQSL